MNKGINQQAAMVDHNNQVVSDTANFAKKVGPLDRYAPTQPGKEIAGMSDLGQPAYSRNALNPAPPLPDHKGLVNKTIMGMNPNIQVR